MESRPMLRIPLDSSTLATVFYAAGIRELEVEFRSGQIYRYSDVPPQAYSELLAAPSKGGYYNFHIRNRYLFRQVTGSAAARSGTAS